MKHPKQSAAQPIKTGAYGPHLDAMDMQNNPLRAAYWGGHELNEYYKMPVPNASGVNHSYMNPTNHGGGSSNTMSLHGKQKTPAGPIQLGKNTY